MINDLRIYKRHGNCWDLWQVPINPIPGAFPEDSNESTRITIERGDEKEGRR